MKYGLIIFVCVLLVACKQKPETLHIADFIKGEINTNSLRKYQHINDTTVTVVYLNQQSTMLNGSTWQFSTMWLNADSLPINAGVERYDEQNNVQMIKQSYFEQIGPESVLEIKGEFDTTIVSPILNNTQTFNINFKPIVDSMVIMKIKADVTATFISEKNKSGEPEKYLEMMSYESTYIDFLDSRRDTTIETSTRKVFSKAKGLIYFEVKSNNETSTYKLVE
jgi:hypothetical protein